MENIQSAQTHSLTIEGRARAGIRGVTAVSSFNEEEIILETQMGEIALLGENLHIDQLDLEAGQLAVTGEISAVEYSEAKPKRERGLFGRRKAK